MEYYSLIKVDWLNACIALRVVGAILVVFLRRLRKICTIHFLRYKIIEAPKNLKTGRVPNLGLELTMHVLKSQIHLVRQSLERQAENT